jgi:hypothetical protein
MFLIRNPPGSANQAEGHEISHKLLINVAEYDEYPVWKLYSIGSFLNPRIFEGTDHKSKYQLTIAHGIYDDRRQTKLEIYSDRLVIE